MPHGGVFDGALGVATGLECIESLMEHGIEPAAPVEIVATSEKDGRFGGMLGAQAMVGAVSESWSNPATDDQGEACRCHARRAGLTPEDYPMARQSPREVMAFLELHIEQGLALEQGGPSEGIVDGISGVFN